VASWASSLGRASKHISPAEDFPPVADVQDIRVTAACIPGFTKIELLDPDIYFYEVNASSKLRMVTRGFVRATIIEALCDVLHQAPEWREAGERLLRTTDKFKFAHRWDQIAEGRDKIFPSTASKMMADRIRKFLSRRLGPGVLKEAA